MPFYQRMITKLLTTSNTNNLNKTFTETQIAIRQQHGKTIPSKSFRRFVKALFIKTSICL